jgi:pyruvate dehydrogenase E1 component alpha subunit
VRAGIAAEALDAIDADAHTEVEAALTAADAAPWPDAAAAFTDVQTTGAGQWR